MDEAKPRNTGPRFGLAGLLMVMLVASVMASAAYYGVTGWRTNNRQYFLVFILVTLTSPVLLLIVVSLFRGLFERLRR